MKEEINQINFTSQGKKNYNCTRNEVLNKINEIKREAANKSYKKTGEKLITLRKSKLKCY